MGDTIGLSDKNFYKSKTFWAAIALIAYGISRIINGEPIDFETVILIAGGFGLYGLRDILGKLVKI
jgi:hypothetical protein